MEINRMLRRVVSNLNEGRELTEGQSSDYSKQALDSEYKTAQSEIKKQNRGKKIDFKGWAIRVFDNATHLIVFYNVIPGTGIQEHKIRL